MNGLQLSKKENRQEGKSTKNHKMNWKEYIGYLRKKQKNTKWKRCWFVLKDRVLYPYRASEDTVAIDTLPVLGWNITLLDQVCET